ncbi:hypothetical protein ACFZCY_19605 [Streptomyces sp. NPDC007983]|uniref:hypothetical protein n=1 Tax=Streptomyces sp. NPDC007983 TaxID=3364800 RepID=UPI0036E22C59
MLDIGSRSVHLQIADLVPDSPPEHVAGLKRSVRLAEATDRQGGSTRPRYAVSSAP